MMSLEGACSRMDLHGLAPGKMFVIVNEIIPPLLYRACIWTILSWDGRMRHSNRPIEWPRLEYFISAAGVFFFGFLESGQF